MIRKGGSTYIAMSRPSHPEEHNPNAYAPPTRAQFEEAVRQFDPPRWTVTPPSVRARQLTELIEDAFADDAPLGDGMTLFQGEMFDCDRRGLFRAHVAGRLVVRLLPRPRNPCFARCILATFRTVFATW